MSHYDYTYMIPPMPPGWSAYTDTSSGRIYFANASTGQSQWEPPMMTLPVQISNSDSGVVSTLLNPSTAKPSTTHESSSSSLTLSSVTQALQPAVATHNSSLLISTRAAMNQCISSQSNTLEKLPLDYPGISAGTLADLIHLQSEWRNSQLQSVSQTLDGKDLEDEFRNSCYYEPIQPFEMPSSLKDRQVELGRVEVRYRTLMDELNKISSNTKK